MQINFVMRHLPAYLNVMKEMSDPVRCYLKGTFVNEIALENVVNVHFFIPGDGDYRESVQFHKGIKVFLPHGISDKRYRTGSNVKEFDFVFVSGPKWVDKLSEEGYPREKLFIGGYPKLDSIFTLRKTLRGAKKNKVVLYAPTHTNSSLCIYPQLLEDMIELPEEVILKTSLHPFNKTDHQPTSKQLIDADVVISDIGSLVWEAWALDIPVVFPDWLVKERVLEKWPGSLTAKLYNDGIGYHADTLEQLPEKIDLALQRGITDAEKEIIDGVFPLELRGISGKVTALHLQHIAANKIGDAACES